MRRLAGRLDIRCGRNVPSLHGLRRRRRRFGLGVAVTVIALLTAALAGAVSGPVAAISATSPFRHCQDGGRNVFADTEVEPEGFQNHVHAAARWYSWMSPPSRSWRSTVPTLGRSIAVADSGG